MAVIDYRCLFEAMLPDVYAHGSSCDPGTCDYEKKGHLSEYVWKNPALELESGLRL